ncbi:MAG TPA: hypothetical protein DD640_04015 [Clostridiales bacterium]|nr:hypothetical protein [Clostridiales bacterium]
MKSSRRSPPPLPEYHLPPRQVQHTRPPHHPARRNPPLGLVIALDIVLLGLGLIIFALFHHVLPRDTGNTGQVLPGSTTTVSSLSTTSTIVTSPSGSTTGESSTPATETTAAVTTATTARGAWGARFADKFTDGGIEQTESSYRSSNISIVIEKVQANEITYYLADIYLRDIQYFRTAFAGGSYAPGRTAEVLDMAVENNAILAITGDYYGIRDSGIVIRNGVLYRESLFADVLVMNNDGSMETFAPSEFDVAAVKANGAWQAWSFGPMLLDGGQPMTTFNSNVTGPNPRSAIGYYEPGHYCFLVVDGRQPGYSVGMSMKQMSQLFYDLGCQAAYNLDGGQSATMTFSDGIADQPYKGGRQVSDIVYIGE